MSAVNYFTAHGDARIARPEFRSLRHPTIAAVIATPVTSTPSFAAVPAPRRTADVSSTGTVVINSSPAIAIHAADAFDLERRVLDVLRQHREALYDQWHREVRRRRRVEF